MSFISKIQAKAPVTKIDEEELKKILKEVLWMATVGGMNASKDEKAEWLADLKKAKEKLKDMGLYKND
jgi:hypothetical protein